jgi:dienelactone hydrolase
MMAFRNQILAGFLFCALTIRAAIGGTAPGEAASSLKMDVETPTGNNFATASFRFWRPEEAKVLRGVVVLVPGSNGDGRAQAEEPFWQDFARAHQFALVGCFFKDKPHENMNIEEYARASAGSGQALLDAIGKFASATPGLDANASLLLWGHSAGGEFNYEFACWKPERVIAFVVNKGGYYYTHLAPAVTRRVPGILFVGEKDEEFRVASVRGIFAINRRAGALWTFAVEPGAGHEVGKTRELAAGFFNTVLKVRLPEAGEAKGLPAWPVGQGWVGDLKSFEVRASADAAKTNGPINSWLPDETMAGQWQAFMKGEQR